MKTLKTVLHRYRYNVDNPAEAKMYKELCKQLTDGRRFFNVLAHPCDGSAGCPAGPVELETEQLFSNQWNTMGVDGHTGYRVFDWYEGIYPNAAIKQGHWLEITSEMQDIRWNTHVCGFCGAQETAAKGYVFCPHCIGSEYLKQTDLQLLRMKPVAEHLPTREPLTRAEATWLVPQYVEAQTVCATSRAVKRRTKQREDIIKKATRDIENAEIKRTGLLWFLDHDVQIDNLIYYNHTGIFTFGWRTPVSDDVASALLDIISEFPYPYCIKGTSRSWEGY